ncbi:MAG: uroporphyrinogen-III synthase [Chloroflexi bacterium]|nr:uroporphyrinogen-III synthase [Chloroflexota bacterium]MBI4506042.1 uroporphyrinogen-III synthase [Chloroflexota bacterium]
MIDTVEVTARPLCGRTIALLEARRAAELAQMVDRAGGTPYVAPVLREVPVEDDRPMRAWLARLTASAFDVVVFLTGVGCRALLERATEDGRLDAALAALARARVIARGPKPVYVLKQHGVRIDFVPPEPNTSDELLAELATWHLDDRALGLQVYGGPTPYLERLRAGLARLGARVEEVAPYRWEGPTDDRAVRELIAACLAGRIDALAILSSSQIANLFAIAEAHGQAAALRSALNDPRVLVAAVGPVAAQAIEAHGVRVGLQPEHPKMGHLVKALGQALAPCG